MSSKKSLDALGDRAKYFERIETEATFIPNLPIYVRLDGRAFSNFTKGLSRPYDARLSQLMVETTKFLVQQFNATIGYTQSDEISLVFKNPYGKGVIFNGKKQKFVSTLASSASAFFNSRLKEFLPEKGSEIPTFDCRAFNVPSEDEAANFILWREQDATKNSILMAGYHHFSFREMQKKNTSEIKGMLFEKGVVWEDYPTFFKYGTYVQKEHYDKEGIIRTHITSIDWFSSLKEYNHPERVQIVMGNYNEVNEDGTETP